MKLVNLFRNILVGGLVMTMLAACDLNLTPTTSIVYEEGKPLFLQKTDVAAFQNGVLSSYRSVQYGSFTQSTEVMCDAFNATIGFGNNYGSVHRADYAFTPADQYVESMWGSHYTAIKNYNIAIDNADLVADDASFKADANILKGIALFARASSYITLARHFGPVYNPATAATDLCVPLVLHYDQLAKPVRATMEEVYNQIIDDLDVAEELLQEAADAGVAIVIENRKIDLTGTVRSPLPTVDAVNALKARAYLDIQDYDQAVSYAEEVLSSQAGYLLATTNDEMTAEYINDQGTEPIVQLYASQTEGAKSNTLYTSVTNTEDDGKVFGSLYVPTKKLVNAYSKSDLRFTNWFTNSLYPVRQAGSLYEGAYVFIKYLDNPALRTGEVETGAHRAKPLLISEMYLIAAEAYAMLGQDGDATLLLNELKTARKAGAVTGDIMDEIKQEWFKETVGEGLRLTCIKRWGEGLEERVPQAEAAAFVQTGPAFTERVLEAGSHVFVWPVPSYELKINENLVQNRGYGVN